jgi:hypothetical protein
MEFKIDPHSFFNPKNRFYKPVCVKCGLMRLNNPITDWCVKQGCDHEEHPDYKRKLKELAYDRGILR